MVKGILINRLNKDLEPQSKMDHADLIAEMHSIENLPTQERLHLARMRRAQQLKSARQKEKEWQKLQRSQKNNLAHSKHHQQQNYHNQQQVQRNIRHISFENSVVLLEAASRNDIQEVANLLQRGITPDAANEDGLTALHQCCIDNNVEMLKLLLDYGANVDAQDSDKWTPLHAAATCGHLNLVRILIGRGANLLAVNTDGNMPYDLCDDEETLDYIEAEMSKRGVTQELIDDTRALTEKQMLSDLMDIASYSGDLEEPDHQGATPLHIASANGYTSVVEFLLEHHVNVDSMDKDLWSPVHAAACWGHLEVLELLAQYGADLNAKNKDDETPSDICEDPEIRERIELLKTEQESKRLAEQQRRRVRRSQSNNTRAQSVRRTSLRDKTLTTKKDAVEEARLRLQAQEVFITPDSTTDPKSIASNNDHNSSTSGRKKSLTTSPNSTNHHNNSILSGNEISSTTTGTGTPTAEQHSISGGRVPVGMLLNNNQNNEKTKDSSGNRVNSKQQNHHNNNIVNNSGSNHQINNSNNNKNGDTVILNGSVDGSNSFYYQNNTKYMDSVDGRKPPEGEEYHRLNNGTTDGGEIIENYEQISNSLMPSSNRNSIGSLHKYGSDNIGERSTEIFQTTKENGKINVQVTVLVDTHNLDNALPSTSTAVTATTNSPNQSSGGGATLANLKKQRAQSRTNVFTSDNGVSTPSPTLKKQQNSVVGRQQRQFLSNGGINDASAIDFQHQNSIVSNDHHENGGNSINQTSSLSPTISQSITKYSGVTGDVVSDSTNSKKCCILM